MSVTYLPSISGPKFSGISIDRITLGETGFGHWLRKSPRAQANDDIYVVTQKLGEPVDNAFGDSRRQKLLVDTYRVLNARKAKLIRRAHPDDAQAIIPLGVDPKTNTNDRLALWARKTDPSNGKQTLTLMEPTGQKKQQVLEIIA
ncbi:MAG: hypothetical protein K2X01_05205 [Cyanobacteria bacterium]|nr:hypothetical protein [Cyanobacteriota bacterium]